MKYLCFPFVDFPLFCDCPRIRIESKKPLNTKKSIAQIGVYRNYRVRANNKMISKYYEVSLVYELAEKFNTMV